MKMKKDVKNTNGNSLESYKRLGDYSTQTEIVLKHLKTKKHISSLDAFIDYKILRLGSVICDLRKKGYPIRTELIRKNGKNYASYSLAKEEVADDN